MDFSLGQGRGRRELRRGGADDGHGERRESTQREEALAEHLDPLPSYRWQVRLGNRQLPRSTDALVPLTSPSFGGRARCVRTSKSPPAAPAATTSPAAAAPIPASRQLKLRLPTTFTICTGRRGARVDRGSACAGAYKATADRTRPVATRVSQRPMSRLIHRHAHGDLADRPQAAHSRPVAPPRGSHRLGRVLTSGAPGREFRALQGPGAA
jgi:hypothetical protein